MYLKSIRVKDFRGIEDRTFYFNEKFNVIIGENAVGKTSLMEAITAGLGGFMKGLCYVNARSINNNEVRIVSYKSSILRAEEAQVDVDVMIGDEEYSWTRKRKFNSKLNDIDFYRDIYEYGRHLAKESASGRFIRLPLISYYGTGRLLKENETKFNPENIKRRLDGYNKALNPNSNYKTLLSWFKATEVSVYKSGKGIDALKSVKKAVRNSFEEIETLYYDEQIDALSILLKDEFDEKKSIKKPKRHKEIKAESKPLSTLSDGQKVLIGLIGDIALRCNLLNPLSGENANEMTPGVVLIDELDLHLHPNWQRKIVSILKETFPKIQFIVTTHSPFIIQSLRNDELIDLQGQNLDDDYRKLSIEEIAEGEMNVNDTNKSLRFHEMRKVADEYFNLIIENKGRDSKKIVSVKERLDQLLLPYYDDPAYVSYLSSFKHILDLK
jgi:predicted ATP-binding protein involved in virulence